MIEEEDDEMNESLQTIEIPYCFLPRFIMDDISKEIEEKKKKNQDTKDLETLFQSWMLSVNYPINSSIN